MRRLIKNNESQLQLIYALEEFPNKITSSSIFLAGPTPRSNDVKSWRLDAIEILRALNYTGTVFIPEPRSGEFTNDYDKQLAWETEGLNRADCIIFWIPRDLEILPAFTTNVEFGEWFQSNKVVLGFPKDAPKTRYLESKFLQLNNNVNYTLEDTLKEAIVKLKTGSLRVNGECYVPLLIWETKLFQDWYQSQLKVGNELRYAKVEYIFTVSKVKKVFFYVLKVHVYVANENRVKENEFIISRVDTCDVVMYYKQLKLEDTIIILTKEFRSPVNNNEEFIYELPGGSSVIDEDNIDIIHDEVFEELGVDLAKEKFIFEDSRQVMGTLSTHKSHLYSIELNIDDLAKITEASKITHGNVVDTELTYVEIKTLKEIISNNLIDWANIGKIFSVLNKKL